MSEYKFTGIINKLVGAFILLLVGLFCLPCFAAGGRNSESKVRIACGSPWLENMVSFIGGQYVSARSLTGLSASCMPYAKSSPSSSEVVFVYDANERKRCKISERRKNVKYIYSEALVSPEQMTAAFLDPAILPFISQNVMKMLAEIDNKHYKHYQQRLAQYQSQIDSAVSVGSYALKDLHALDLTGLTGAWIRAASRSIVRPPKTVWNSWLSGDEAALEAALDEAERRGWLIIVDASTPAVILSHTVSRENKLALTAYSVEMDYFSYIHTLYDAISKRIKQKEKGNKS